MIDTLKPAYNIRPAESAIGYTHSEKGKESKRGDKKPMFGRTGPNSPRFGMNHSLETKAA